MSEDSPEYVIPTYLYRKIDKLQREYAEMKPLTLPMPKGRGFLVHGALLAIPVLHTLPKR